MHSSIQVGMLQVEPDHPLSQVQFSSLSQWPWKLHFAEQSLDTLQKKKLQTNIKNYCQQKKGEGGWVAKHSQHWACNRSLDSKSCTEWKLHLFLISLNFKSSQECIWLQFYRCFTYLFHFIVITIYLLLHFFFSRLISRQLLGKLVERINWKNKKNKKNKKLFPLLISEKILMTSWWCLDNF